MPQEHPSRVIMTRQHLDGIPIFPPPEGYSLRWYAPEETDKVGQECPHSATGRNKDHWVRIHQLAEPSLRIVPELFDRLFGGNEQLLVRRQVFLVHEDGLAVGTATAWFDPDFAGMEFGRIHWVAVLPEFQRRGLAKVLMSASCNRLRELGYKRAYLVTWSDRPWAIRLYEQFGFAVSRVETK
jgi:ribosomal protein S18 acetylase RimI-like enzyme